LTADGDFHVHLEGTLALDEERAFNAGSEGDGAGYALGLDGFDFREASAGFEVGVDDVVSGLGTERQWVGEKKR